MSTYAAKILSALSGTTRELLKSNPDVKHNLGNLFGTAYMWDFIADYAKKQSDAAWKQIEEDMDELPDPGEYDVASSPNFIFKAKVTQKVRRFSADALAAALKKKYKVPEHVTKELVEAAKVPTKSQRMLAIVERNM